MWSSRLASCIAGQLGVPPANSRAGREPCPKSISTGQFGHSNSPALIDSSRSRIRRDSSILHSPIIHFTRHVSLAVEGGYDWVQDDRAATEGSLVKVTVAPQVSINNRWSSRPVIRAFATWATWTEDFVDVWAAPTTQPKKKVSTQACRWKRGGDRARNPTSVRAPRPPLRRGAEQRCRVCQANWPGCRGCLHDCSRARWAERIKRAHG